MISAQVETLEKENIALKATIMSLQARLGSKQKPRHCEHCKHFSHHFAYNKNVGFTSTNCGYCLQGRKNKREKHIEDSCSDFEFGLESEVTA